MSCNWKLKYVKTEPEEYFVTVITYVTILYAWSFALATE